MLIAFGRNPNLRQGNSQQSNAMLRRAIDAVGNRGGAGKTAQNAIAIADLDPCLPDGAIDDFGEFIDDDRNEGHADHQAPTAMQQGERNRKRCEKPKQHHTTIVTMRNKRSERAKSTNEATRERVRTRLRESRSLVLNTCCTPAPRKKVSHRKSCKCHQGTLQKAQRLNATNQEWRLLALALAFALAQALELS